jgi:D-aminoacyl-tRNA deacylase
MIALIQRVSEASVSINHQITSQIKQGFLVLLGITHTDTPSDIDYLVKKL